MEGRKSEEEAKNLQSTSTSFILGFSSYSESLLCTKRFEGYQGSLTWCQQP